jgi:glycosyltransferase involved in cell wall biosynthesis
VNLIISYANEWKAKKVKFIFACRLKNDPAAIRKKTEVEQKLKAHGVFDMVVLSDSFADMAKLYNLSDIIIFPVQNMTGKFDIPLAAIEPMACEKPVVVSDLSILKEFANAQNSVTIQRGNVAQLKDAIMDLYDNPEKRKMIGKNGRKFCAENFDIKLVAEQYKTVYETL